MPYTTEQIQNVSTRFRVDRRYLATSVAVDAAISALRYMDAEARNMICEWTGNIIEGEPFDVYEYRTFNWRTSEYTPHGLHRYENQEAAVAAGWFQCDHCGEWANTDWNDEAQELYGNMFCSHDCANECGWHTCERCGDWYHEDDEVRAGDYYYCSDYCARADGWSYCDRCDEWHPEDEMTTVRVGDYTEQWCEYCRDDRTAMCEGCGDVFPMDDMAFDDEDYTWYCRDCADPTPGDPTIHSYNYTPRLVFYGGDDEACPLYLGVELETDSGRSRNAYARELSRIEDFSGHFYMKNDGSLCVGVEIVGHPMTLAYHDSIRGMYEHISEAASAHGFVSHNSGNCGLHVHGNNTFFGKSGIVQDAGKYKLMRLFQRFEPQLMVFSRRTSDRWCHYDTGYSYEPAKDKVNVHNMRGRSGEPSIISKSQSFVNNDRDKYRAVNICHRDTVEIRIFRGTLKWSTYFASLALVDGLFRAAKAHGSTWVESVNWYELIEDVVSRVEVEYPKLCLENYLTEKGLR